MHDHRLEVFSLVSETHENVDLVLCIKNRFMLEGIINSSESWFSFLNRSIPFSSKEQAILKPREQRFINIEAPIINEISELVMVMRFDIGTEYINIYN